MFSLQDYRDEALQCLINTIFCSIICCLIFCCCSDFARREGESYQRGERKWPLSLCKCVCVCSRVLSELLLMLLLLLSEFSLPLSLSFFAIWVRIGCVRPPPDKEPTTHSHTHSHTLTHRRPYPQRT